MPVTGSRSLLRMKLGVLYFRSKRRAKWLLSRSVRYARYRSASRLPYQAASHETLLLRKLANVDMWMQHNKVKNLSLAAQRMDGLILKPGETFSYWRTIGKPTRSKGYLDGMLLQSGQVRSGVGGGLCQLSNLIYWMTLHTPLTVTERHRHSYDVFPDSGRTQPFGSGATCYYNYIDLQIRNDTDTEYQLGVRLTDTHLTGEWRSASPPLYRYEIVEKNHRMAHEFGVGYVRSNEIWRWVQNRSGDLLREEPVTSNRAIMMYDPSLPPAGE